MTRSILKSAIVLKHAGVVVHYPHVMGIQVPLRHFRIFYDMPPDWFTPTAPCTIWHQGLPWCGGETSTAQADWRASCSHLPGLAFLPTLYAIWFRVKPAAADCNKEQQTRNRCACWFQALDAAPPGRIGRFPHPARRRPLASPSRSPLPGDSCAGETPNRPVDSMQVSANMPTRG